MNSVCFFLGASITACWGTGRHIVALEKDEAIFKAMLLPMRRTIEEEETIEEEQEEEHDTTEDPDAMEVEVFSFAWKENASK